MNTSNTIPWNNQKLEPVIITYNRAEHLKNTLSAFLNANLPTMRLHVLDNASTDETPAIVKTFQEQMPNLIYHRNRYNIGGNSNILRSVELSDSEYHWVIGDDDQWNLNETTLGELAQALEVGEADVIRLGWLTSENSKKTLKNSADLALEESMFFASVSMISATIIRRAVVARYLPQAYQNISDSYPQLVALIRATEEMPLAVYTLSQHLMIHTPSHAVGYFCGDLEWCSGWFRGARFFTNPILQARFVNEVIYYMCRNKPGKLQQFIFLTKVLLYFKSFQLNQWPYLLAMLTYGKGWRFKIALLILINCVTPTFLLNLMRKSYFKLAGLPQKTINVDRSRL